jgi:predicted nuclease of predicted toxin-antitoxin system
MLDFLVDENLPLSAASILREQGHRARHVRHIGMRGARDEALFSEAQERSWIIVTRDLGFGNLLDYPPGTHAGIVILRLPSTFTAKQINGVLESFVSSVEPDTLRGTLTVVEPDRYRIRRREVD